MIALTALRVLEIAVNATVAETETKSGAHILEEMSHLNSVWLWYPGKRKPEKVLEAPTDLQAEVLKAFSWAIGDGGVLQSLDA